MVVTSLIMSTSTVIGRILMHQDLPYLQKHKDNDIYHIKNWKTQHLGVPFFFLKLFGFQ